MQSDTIALLLQVPPRILIFGVHAARKKKSKAVYLQLNFKNKWGNS